MPPSINYAQAVNDFYEARRKASLKEIIARITGEQIELFSYEEIRQTLRAYEGNKKTLKEIPLDAIIGSVGRYTDFTKGFLPRRDSDLTRWAIVMEKTTDSEGLPPIEVYQLGDAYFVQDGNHRVSVARELGGTYIQAYVTEVRARVPLSPEIQPDQLIIVAEQLDFVELTKIDQLRPEANLMVTIPGQYPILLEHISVHRYFLGLEKKQEIPFFDAVSHWYDQVYMPVVKIIRERRILNHFPNRTETDLYLWISRHGAELEESLGWKLGVSTIADDLVFSSALDMNKSISRLANRILDLVTPDPLESGPPVGHWRKKYIEDRHRECLFENILVAIGKDPSQWYSLDQAMVIGRQENSHLRGLHIIDKPGSNFESATKPLKDEFNSRCQNENISGELAIEVGGVARTICERSHWADIVISVLAHPPGDKPIERLESGFRTMIRRCPRPILAVPCHVSDLKHVLLAYTDSPKAQEALYIAAYMAGKWNSDLTVLTIDQESGKAEDIQKPAREYLAGINIQAEYICQPSGDIPTKILETAEVEACDLILIGGYKMTPILEVVLGSIVDEVLRKTKIPVLVCR
jgi:nucleotide-binding universal stress UspA family protein